MNIRIDGLEKLVRGMKNLGEASQKRIMRNAARAGATKVRSALRKDAPKGSGDRSKASQKYGRLRDNIKISQIKAGGQFLAFYRVHTGRAFWGDFLERGTKHIRPNFWFSRSVERVKEPAAEAMLDSAKRSILREVQKMKR